MTTTWFITGANRGFGYEIAKTALAAGDAVVSTARNPQQAAEALGDHGDRLLTARLDVTDPVSIEQAVAEAVDRFGRIDVLVNNAGYGQLGVFEELTPEQIQRQFDTNVFGVFDVTRAVLPILRAQRSGRIITIASISGITSGAGSSMYSATKFAVTGWSEGLAEELAPLGIHVTVVHPGMFSTDFLDPS
ncbi:MAG: SDR family NAD(P)-dependent oxidoreductase, partial [Kribbellaceae bacterium]|nr:SDR family NAD(P)-dependent oxidoreductase [Kribbellaceae bacterium]